MQSVDKNKCYMHITIYCKEYVTKKNALGFGYIKFDNE